MPSTWQIPADGGQAIEIARQLDGSAQPRGLGRFVGATGTGFLTWTKDGSSLIGPTRERFNLHLYPTTGVGPKQLTSLEGEIFVRGTLSTDGRHIIASRGRLLRDTFTIRGFR